MTRQGFIGRMNVYLMEMFPIPQRFATSALLYISFVTLLSRIHGVQVSLLSLYTVSGILSIFALTLILRLMDELKDRDVDRELFRGRPLPSGKVLESDIAVSLVAVICLYLLANVWKGNVFWVALTVLGYALLMFKFFFIPRILRRYLLLNLATHNPIIPLMLFYIVILFSAELRMPPENVDWRSTFFLIAMFWSMLFAWEIARKIRSREEENAYVTYSQIFGRGGAVLVAGGAQSLTLCIAVYFYQSLSLTWVFLALVMTGYARAVWAHVRFMVRPNPVTSKLKPFAEQYVLTVLAAGVVERLLQG